MTMKIKAPARDGGVVYMDDIDSIRFTGEGRAFVYFDNRAQPIELHPELFSPARYERMLFEIAKTGHRNLIDMTQPGKIIYIYNPEEPETILDPGAEPQPTAEVNKLHEALRDAGFEVKAPE